MPDEPNKTGSMIEALFKIVLTALIGVVTWQQSSLISEIAAARAERAADNEAAEREREASRKEREHLTAWALGVSKQQEKTAATVAEVKKTTEAVKVTAEATKKAVDKLE